MKERVEKKDLLAYLRKLAAASLFVVSITSPVFEIGSSIKSAYEVAHVADKHSDFFGDGPFWIESRPGDQWQETSPPDAVIANYAVVWTVHARLARNGAVIGGYESLMAKLAGYEALIRSSPKSVEGAGAGTILVKQPSDPFELAELREILLKYAVAFAIDDGSGSLHAGNVVMGNGIHSEIEDSFKA
ncbi:hypothetical protein IAE40_13445 [Pseudomonas sp. S44]|uniref:hypothetical protein n=1 Tax=Pseudomonas sp. S44 TaxID=2767450 RepID=UPI00190C0401|nr:hypothetical protein [Pseudomonas sp. S44]MBK0059644.1 hypothetical protein [Pseudomonas sp. S44]